jgi:hypothetical protein
MALDLLADGGCVSSPVLLGYTQEEQDDDMWIPRGYIVYILMTWCSGVVLLDFWRRDPAERQEIRDAFRTAYEYVLYRHFCYPLIFIYDHYMIKIFFLISPFEKLSKRLSKMSSHPPLPRLGQSHMGPRAQKMVSFENHLHPPIFFFFFSCPTNLNSELKIRQTAT